LLDQSRQRVHWVFGPPGAGKTVLVASYLQAHRIRALWYQLDEDDADAATFLSQYRLVAASSAGRARRPLPMLKREHQPGLLSFARQYFQALFRRLRPPFVLVFDNYQDVPVTSAFHDVIRCALAELPQGGSAIVISRSEPPPQMARLRASHLLGFVTWRDLRLTVEETAGLARLRGAPALTRPMLKELHDKTDGWAAGVVLQLERVRRERTSLPTLVTRTSGEVFHYFADEILAAEDDETQSILLETAFLGSASARVASVLTGSPRAGEVLERLGRRNYFTDIHLEAEPVYQLHPMFREFLVERARGLRPDASGRCSGVPRDCSPARVEPRKPRIC
jgi:ATP/maltotriose-dependent transcriptional regulator MalT